MSRIGKLPVPVPAGVDITVSGALVTVKGPKGSLEHTVPAPINVAQEDAQLVVSRPDDERNSRALHGLTRTLIANMITGVTEGYEKKLEIVGDHGRDQRAREPVEGPALPLVIRPLHQQRAVVVAHHRDGRRDRVAQRALGALDVDRLAVDVDVHTTGHGDRESSDS